MSAQDRSPHPMAGAAGHDGPHTALEGRCDVFRPTPCPPLAWDPHGPQTASQRTLARFRAARRPESATPAGRALNNGVSRPRQLLLIELQRELPFPPSDPRSPDAVAAPTPRRSDFGSEGFSSEPLHLCQDCLAVVECSLEHGLADSFPCPACGGTQLCSCPSCRSDIFSALAKRARFGVAVPVTPPLCPMGGTFRLKSNQGTVPMGSAPLSPMGETRGTSK